MMIRLCCRYGLVLAGWLVVSLTMTSCVDTRKITFFENYPDTVFASLDRISLPTSIIQPNDILELRIGGESESTVQYITQYFGASQTGALNCIVDADGNVELPRLGKLQISGMSRDSAADYVRGKYAEILLNPVVTLRYVNFRFAVLGEVKTPGYFSTSNEKINLLEALAQAGGTTQYSRLDNVRLIKDVNGDRSIVTLNFNDKSILNSPYFYLSRYDVLYVAPSDKKATSDNVNRSLPVITSGITLLALIVTFFRN